MKALLYTTAVFAAVSLLNLAILIFTL